MTDRNAAPRGANSEMAVQLCAASVTMLGLAVLLGWILDIATLKSVLPGLATMKANTAFGFVLSGVALGLACIETRVPQARRLRRLLATLVMLLAVLTVAQDLLGFDFGIDQLLFDDSGSSRAPGRMAPATAFGFVLCGTALLAIGAPRGQFLVQTAAAMAGIIAVLALVAYAYNARSLYNVFPYYSMAVHTAGGIAILGLGLMFARPEHGLAGIVGGSTVGGTLARRLIPAAWGIPFFLGWLMLAGEHAGYYDIKFGTATFALASMLTFSLFIAVTARSLHRSDLRRLAAEAAEQESRVALAASEARLATVVENLSEGLIIGDSQGNIFHWNPAALVMHGYASLAECQRKLPEFTDTFELRTVSDGRVLPFEQWPMPRILGGTVLRDSELRLRRLDQGWERIVSYAGALVRSPTGESLAYLAVTDVTARKQTEAALSESEERLRLFIEHAPAALAMFDRDMRYLSASRRWLADYGLEARVLIGHSHYEIFPEIPQRWKEIHYRALGGEVVLADEDPFERADGTVQWLRWEVRPWYSRAGNVAGIVVFSEDITRRKDAEVAQSQAERAFREQQAQLAGIIGSAMDAIITIDSAQRIVMFNPAAESMFGHAASAALGLPIDALLPQRFRHAHAQHVRSFGETGITARRMGALQALAGLRASGEEFPVEASISQLDAGGQRFYTVIMRDITARQKADDDLKALAATLEQRVIERTAELADARDAADAASRAKSQFLANMSHELRTPLNSLLMLAQLLAENSQGNLNAKQMEFARIIQRSGTDLLVLINDLLDLAKIEAGRVTVDTEEVHFAALRETLERALGHLAQEKGLEFAIDLAPDLPVALYTDAVRLQQVMRNLIANAIKFTPAGRVVLRIETATGGWTERHPVLDKAHTVIALSVADTGVGIAPDKQQLIFEAFQQADSGTARKYGGTGLGLSISREIAHLLGGELTLSSQQGVGSTFTLYLPLGYAGPGDGTQHERSLGAGSAPPTMAADILFDDRENLAPGESVVLLVEDDTAFARVLIEIAHDKGMKALVADTGAKALALAQEYKPVSITLDLILPDMDGWTVYERLRLNPATAEIPVLVISVRDERHHALEMGALAVLVKPVSRPALDETFERIKTFTHKPLRDLLVVEDNAIERAMIVEMLRGADLAITEVDTGRAALAALRAQHFDCMVLDLMLPDVSGFDVLESLQADDMTRELPVVVHTAKELTSDDETRLQAAASKVIVKDGRSYARLLAETSRFLHRSLARLPSAQQRILQGQYEADRPLAGRKVMLVDDDIRNVFALAALLERHHLVVVTAMSGREALELLPQHPDTAAVLMDMMMPDMDGYEATVRLRALDGYQGLPVIALTAKAMKGDREQCLAAGCSDYLSKPVDADRLLTMLREWIRQ